MASSCRHRKPQRRGRHGASVALAAWAVPIAIHDGLTWTRFIQEDFGFSVVLVATIPILGAFVVTRHPWQPDGMAVLPLRSPARNRGAGRRLGASHRRECPRLEPWHTRQKREKERSVKNGSRGRFVVAIASLEVVLLGAAVLAAVRVKDRGPGKEHATSNTIETSSFRLTAPAGVKNESTGGGKGSILLNYSMPYGVVSVEVFISTLKFDEITRNGKVTETDVRVAGTLAKRYDSDYSRIIFGRSDKPLVRYGIMMDSIPKPSASRYTDFSLTLLNTRDIGSAELSAFRSDAQTMIDSLVIK